MLTDYDFQYIHENTTSECRKFQYNLRLICLHILHLHLYIKFDGSYDSENDLFKPTGPFTRLHMKIYNRWGALLFKSDHLNEGWNGRTTAGEEVPAGTYFYIIETDIDTYKGSLTLIR